MADQGINTDAELRARIGSRLESGALPPRADQLRIFGGLGDEGLCACCDQKISKTDVQYDIESGNTVISMHLWCYERWSAAARAAAESR